MSNTPRTDEAKFDIAYDSTGEKQEFVVPVKLSEQLETSLVEKERELKMETACKAEIYSRANIIESNLTQLQAVVRELAKQIPIEDYNHPWLNEDMNTKIHRCNSWEKMKSALTAYTNLPDEVKGVE